MSLNPQLYPPIAPVEGSAPRPFWSVIVPAYKPEYLPQALRSVMEQAPGADQMEILVLDDCSPHKLEPIVRQICGDRATYIRQTKNLGTYANENAGVAQSRGIWIHILNDDDWVLPGFYSIFQSSLKNQPPNVGAACCGQINVDQAGRELARQPVLRTSPGIIDDFISIVGVANPIHPIGTIIRRNAYEHLGGYYLQLNYCADWELNKRIATFYDWWYEPAQRACYRHRLDSVTNEGRMSGEQIRNLGHCIELSANYLPADKREKIVEKSRETCGAAALRVAAKSLRNGGFAAAILQIQAGLEITRSPQMLQQLADLMNKPEAIKIRELLPRFFKMISIRSGSENAPNGGPSHES